jgi:hypothetical protein
MKSAAGPQMEWPPLKFLHSEESLSNAKLAQFERMETAALQRSLLPGGKDCLKARLDGTLLDGHHRIYVLRGRGVDIDALPREIVGYAGYEAED